MAVGLIEREKRAVNDHCFARYEAMCTNSWVLENVILGGTDHHQGHPGGIQQMAPQGWEQFGEIQEHSPRGKGKCHNTVETD